MKHKIKIALLNYPMLNYLIKKVIGKPDEFELILGLYLKKRKQEKHAPFFLQIGANNGINHDPFYKFIVKYNLSGILIEPVPHLFKQLKKNYRNREGLFFENIAIGNPNDQLTFYRIKSDENVQYDQLGSFDKATILKQKKNIPNLEELIIEEPVQVVHINALIEKYKRERIDILVMDTEGYDGKIIKMIDFKAIDFDLIIFESKHLTYAEHNFCMDLLGAHNFKSFVNGSDTLCVKEDKDLGDILKMAMKFIQKISI